MRSTDEIHSHLVEQVNLALRYPGMYGDEATLRQLLIFLLFVEDNGTIDAWQEELRAGGAFYSTGVSGAVSLMFPDADLDIVYSVYADFARQRQWLALDRELTAGEYGTMADQLADWCADDRHWQDVLATFGPPSILIGGINERYGKTLGYATARADDPMISFHLWNRTGPEPAKRWPAYDDPILLAVRRGNTPFEKCLTFTPEGTRRRPPRPDWLPTTS
jgi:hypothetical protein